MFTQGRTPSARGGAAPSPKKEKKEGLKLGFRAENASSTPGYRVESRVFLPGFRAQAERGLCEIRYATM